MCDLQANFVTDTRRDRHLPRRGTLAARWWVLLLLCISFGPLAGAETPADLSTPGTVRPVAQADLDAARQALASDASLGEAEKHQAEDLLKQVDQDLKAYRQARTALDRLQRQITAAPGQIAHLNAQLRNPGQSPHTVPKKATLDQLQLLLSQWQDEQNSDESRLAEVQATLATLQTGAQGIGDKISAYSQGLSQLAANLQAPSGDVAAGLAQAQRLALRARYQLHQSQRQRLQLQLGNLDLLTKLAQTRHDLLDAQLAQLRQQLLVLTKAIQGHREQQAKQAVEEAEALQSEAARLPPALRQVAAANARYRKQLESLVSHGRGLDQRIIETQRQAKVVATEFDTIRQRVEAIGLSHAVGRMLHHRRAALLTIPLQQGGSADATEAMDQATTQQMAIEDLRQSLGDLQQSVARIMRQLPATLSTRQREALRDQALKLSQARQQALDALIAHYGQTVAKLSQLDLARQQLAQQITTFGDYIDKQLIWVPGSGLRPLLEPSSWLIIGRWISNPAGWADLSTDLVSLVMRYPGGSGALLLVLVLLLVSRQHADHRLAAIAHDTRRIRSDRFWLTVEALWITVALAAPVALLLVVVALTLQAHGGNHPFTQSIAGALFNVGIMVGVVSLVSAICRKQGLAERHLQWPLPVRESLLRETRWFLPAILPLGLVIGATYRGGTPEPVQALGQLAFVLLMVVIGIVLVRLLGRRADITRYLCEHRPDGWLAQSHFIWYRLLLLLPALLAIAALSNYYFAAVEFAVRLRMTIWLIFALLLARDLLLRWFYITERRLRLSTALRQREESRARRDAGEEGPGDPSSLDLVEEQQPDYTQLSEQSRRLVQATFLFGVLFGVWSIWVDLIPLLGSINQVALPIHAERVVDGVARQSPVMLTDLLFALFVLLVTIIAARNLPGLMEMVLLRRLPLAPGSRFAITSLSQYLIVSVGLVTAFAVIGLQWSSIQWLVAALGVGVGFGLQEIVANFISGVILLFEQPIRVGDVITVDDTTGTVTRLRIRATTITTWDHQELLVPNKQFITGKVLNWTLSSTVNRSIITVGVAYGSDVARAMKLMIESAREHPDILDDPPPFASFEEFGDSALTLRLRAYMGGMDRRLGITSELYQAINRRFEQAGIVVAFPQLDVHMEH